MVGQPGQRPNPPGSISSLKGKVKDTTINQKNVLYYSTMKTEDTEVLR